jgi:hypothetical protein
MSMRPAPWPAPAPEVAAIRAIYRGKRWAPGRVGASIRTSYDREMTSLIEPAEDRCGIGPSPRLQGIDITCGNPSVKISHKAGS